MLNERFQRIFCINLDKRADRWSDASSLFERFSVSVERIPGIEDDIPWNGLRKTVIGIFELAIRENYESILVFEDDVEWDEGFYPRFEECWSSLPEDWHMFYFSAAHQRWPQACNENLFRLSWSTAAHAIAFRRSCFEGVLSCLKENMEPIDVIYSKLQPKLNAYCCIEPIAWQRKSFSDIEGQEKWYPYLKDLGFYTMYMNGLVTIDGNPIERAQDQE